MREWSKRNVVFTSELKAPDDFLPVLPYKGTRGRTEHLFVWAKTPFWAEILSAIEHAEQ